MNDILPNAKDEFLDSSVWGFILEQSKLVLEGYGYSEIRLPVVEDTQLFTRIEKKQGISFDGIPIMDGVNRNIEIF